jgi:hypothetical protein
MILDILTNIAPLGWVTQYVNQYYLEVWHLKMLPRHYCVKGLLENTCSNREFKKKHGLKIKFGIGPTPIIARSLQFLSFQLH